jgi:hypothetical protein
MHGRPPNYGTENPCKTTKKFLDRPANPDPFHQL